MIYAVCAFADILGISILIAAKRQRLDGDDKLAAIYFAFILLLPGIVIPILKMLEL